MANVDDRIVQMSFDNKNFESNVATSMGTLARLKAALTFGKGKSTGLDDLQASANKFSMGNIGAQITGASTKFLGLATIGITALSSLTNKAIDTGIAIGKSFTTGPIAAGFENYETQINAVQTILANTGLKGAAGLGQVNVALQDLNTYANQTVYNFSDMAKNIGTFTAAGVKLQPATDAIKGIANLAALSGSTADQASAAMYQLSQAVAANKVGAQDWISVVNAGIGGKVFQKALFDTAVQLGTLKGVPVGTSFDEWTKKGNTFKEAMATGAITGTVLTQTLSQFTGDLTDQQLKAKGYTADQIKQIQELAKTASNAATQIKTFTQLKSALKEEVATAYATIFKTVFGDINAATKLFSTIHTVVENALTKPIYAVNTLLEATAKLGGRSEAISAFKDAFKALSAIMDTVKSAFREIFPKETAQGLLSLINAFHDFTSGLLLSKKSLGELKSTFAGVFAVIDIVKKTLGALLGVVGKVLSQFSGAGSGVLGFTSSLGDFLVAVDKSITRGSAFYKFFSALGDYLVKPIDLLKKVAAGIANLFKGVQDNGAKAVGDSFGRISDRLAPLAKLLGLAGPAWDKFVEGIAKAKTVIQPTLDAIGNAFSQLGSAISKGLSSGNFNGVLDVINTGLLAGILVLVKKFFSKGLSVDFGGGFLGSIKESFETLTGSMKTMQQSIKANTLLKIAEAIALLAASLFVLSLIDSDKLTKAFAGIGVAMGELLAAMAILTKISKGAGFIKIPIIAASMILLAGAVLILTLAVKALSGLSWQELTKGLVGVGVLLGIIAAASYPLSANAEGMIAAGVGITAIAVGLKILVGVIQALGEMDLKTLGKGLGAITVALLGIALATKLFPKSMVAIGVGLLAISVALLVLVQVVKQFAALDYKVLAKGIGAIAVALLAIGLAMKVMGGPGLIVQAAGLVLIAAALETISGVIFTLGKMSYKTLATGIGAIAASLVVLAGGLYIMTGALPGAAALLVTAAALAILTPVLVKLGNMSWKQIAKGLIALAATFAVIAVAGLLMAPVIPVIVGLGIALLALGAGIALIGVGALAIAAAFALIASVGTAGITVLLAAISGLIAKIPELAVGLANGLVQFIGIILAASPGFVAAFGKILDAVLQVLIKEIPVLGTAISTLITTLIAIIVAAAPQIIAAGLSILVALLQGIQDNIGQIATQVGTIILTLIAALTVLLPQIVAAGLNLLVQLLLGIANGLPKVVAAVATIITKFIDAVGAGLNSIVTAGTSLITSFLSGVAAAIPKIADAVVKVIIAFVNAIASNVYRIADALLTGMTDAINGLATAIRQDSGPLGAAFGNLGGAIIDGIINGLGGLVGALTDSLKGKIGSVLDSATGWIPGLGGPAHAIGEPIMNEIAKGIGNNSGVITDSLQKNVKNSLETAGKTLSSMNLDDVINLSPVISPVLDLSNVTKDASKISGLLSADSFNPSVSLDSATSISASTLAAAQAAQDVAAPSDTTPAPIVFNQTNTSPTALSASDIYRNTKSQLALAKEALS